MSLLTVFKMFQPRQLKLILLNLYHKRDVKCLSQRVYNNSGPNHTAKPWNLYSCKMQTN